MKRTSWDSNGVALFRRDRFGYWWVANQTTNRPPRWLRKRVKLQAKGTYHRADQWWLDRSRKRVIESADRLAKHLNCTGAELLAEVGFQ